MPDTASRLLAIAEEVKQIADKIEQETSVARGLLCHDYAPPPHAADATACMDDEPPSRPA